jgi:hypothetical protein
MHCPEMCLQQVSACLHCLLLPSSDTGSATGEHLAYLHSMLLVRQRESLQQVSTWRVCIVCYSLLLIQGLQQVSIWHVCIVCFSLIGRQCLQQVSTGRICIVCFWCIGRQCLRALKKKQAEHPFIADVS